MLTGKSQDMCCRDHQSMGARYRPYHRRQNVIITWAQKMTGHLQRYFVELVGVADTGKSLADVFVLFFGSVTLPQLMRRSKRSLEKTGQFRLMFQFFVCLYFVHNKFVGYLQRQTESELMDMQDIFGDGQNGVQQYVGVRKQMKMEIIGRCKQKVSLLFRQRFQITIEDIQHAFEDLKREYVQSILGSEELKSYVLEQYWDDERMCRQLLEHWMDKLYGVQFMKKQFKRRRFDHFCDEYNGFLNSAYTVMKEENNRYRLRTKNDGFSIKRYTLGNRDQVLISLRNLVAVRKKGVDYGGQSFEMAKQLIGALTQHHKLTRRYYPLLNLDSALLDQISLKVHLSYENILNETLGLMRQPLPTEAAICFRASPFPFDSFSAPVQYRQSNEVKFYSMLYGHDNLLTGGGAALSRQKQKEYADKLRIMKESEGWRCLMVISYLMSGVELGRRRDCGPMGFEEFKNFIERQSAMMEEDESLIFGLLGSGFKRLYEGKKQKSAFSFEQGVSYFNNLLQAQTDHFQLSPGIQFVKMTNLLTVRHFLLKELTQLAEGNKIFQTVSNALKYLTRLYLAILVDMQSVMMVCRYLMMDFARGVALLRVLSKRLHLSRQDKKSSLAEQSVEKLDKYREKHAEKQSEKINYLLKKYPEQFGSYCDLMKMLNEVKDQLRPLSEDSRGFEKNEMQNYVERITDSILRKLQEPVKRVRRYGQRIFRQQFLKEKYFKKGDLQMKHLKVKVQTMLLALLKIDDENIIFLQSVMLPILENKSGSEMGEGRLREELQLFEYLKLTLEGDNIL